MVLKANTLAEALLSGKPWTSQARRDLAASVLLITSPIFEALSAGIDGLDKHRFKVDVKLISDLFESCPLALRVSLVSTPAFSRLPPHEHRRLFLRAWRDRRLTPGQRRVLAAELPGFIRRNPDRVRDYRDIIRTLLWSPRRDLCLRGLYLAGFLNDLEPRDVARLTSKLTAAWFGHRMHALNGLCLLLKRHRELEPGIAERAASERVRTLAQRIQRSDPDQGARSCAWYLLKAFRAYDRSRRAPGRARR